MKKENNEQKKADLINIIYDTLFSNKQYEQLNLDEVTDEFVNGRTNKIHFTIYDTDFTLTLTED